MKFEMYKGDDKQWRWRLVAINGEVIADSAEGYHNKGDCLNAIDLVQAAKNSPVTILPDTQ